MRNWKQRLNRLEEAITPRAVGMAVIFSRNRDRMVARARGQRIHRKQGESEDEFLCRAVATLGPVTGIVMVPEKQMPGAVTRVRE